MKLERKPLLWLLLGFAETVMFPLVALGFAIAGYSSAEPLSVTSLATFYVGGVLLIAINPLIDEVRSYSTPEVYLSFSEGAFYGAVAIYAISVPLVFLSLLSHQSAVVIGLFGISFGVFWALAASTASSYGLCLAREESEIAVRPHAPKALLAYARVFLVTFLGRKDKIGERYGELSMMAIAVFLYTLGWITLTSTGTTALVIVAVIPIVGAPIMSYLAFKHRTTSEERTKISQIL